MQPLGPIVYIIRARVILLRDLGADVSPKNALQFIQGLETLPLHIREHCYNASAVAEYLGTHDKVATVTHLSNQTG